MIDLIMADSAEIYADEQSVFYRNLEGLCIYHKAFFLFLIFDNSLYRTLPIILFNQRFNNLPGIWIAHTHRQICTQKTLLIATIKDARVGLKGI